jgi:hypothetical protein
VKDEAVMALLQVAERITEDDLLGAAGRVQQDGVVELAGLVEVTQHAHDRGDATTRADEQQLGRQLVRKQELTLHPAQRGDRPRASTPYQVWGDLALVDVLDRDADQPVGPLRIGGQRIGPPVPHPVDVDADAQILTGLVSSPPVAGLDEHGGGVRRLGLDALDPPAQLPGGPERIDELEIVVNQQWRAQRSQRAQNAALDRVNVGPGSSLRHFLPRFTSRY